MEVVAGVESAMLLLELGTGLAPLVDAAGSDTLASVIGLPAVWKPRRGFRAALTAQFWQALYGKWDSPLEDREPGYSILLMLPGDLPVFLDIALESFRSQDLTHCAEILVIPDRPFGGFRRRFDSYASSAPDLPPLRFVNLSPVGRLFTYRLNHPHHNYFLQLHSGIRASRGTHICLHDADLFFLNPAFLRSHYDTCIARDLAVLGQSPVWDEWYRQNGYEHVVSTWEMMMSAEWALRFPPYMHRGHLETVDGTTHEFDATLLPQCLTPGNRIGCAGSESDFVHFNYVFGTYRWYQRTAGPFEDTKLRILLIRLLIDSFDCSGTRYDVPGIHELQRGLSDASCRVTYMETKTRNNYPAFRSKLATLLERGGFSEARVIQRIRRGIEPFDKAFDWAG